MCHIVVMVSFNMRQLRDSKRLKETLRAGKTIELRDRNQVIANIIPARKRKRTVKWPDFAARRKRIFGDRVLPGADLLIEERGRF
jgi:antitoxin (DNA-binding transcriptional repressor) of toxin-antitoxin stability system